MGLAPAVEDSHMSERVRFEAQETAAEAHGVSTIHEAAGRSGLTDLELIAILPDARVAGRARTMLCGQDDNLMVPAAIAHVRLRGNPRDSDAGEPARLDVRRTPRRTVRRARRERRSWSTRRFAM
jgi:hypothetical protein